MVTATANSLPGRRICSVAARPGPAHRVRTGAGGGADRHAGALTASLAHLPPALAVRRQAGALLTLPRTRVPGVPQPPGRGHPSGGPATTARPCFLKPVPAWNAHVTTC